MSARDLDHAELRADEVAKLASKNFSAARGAILAGDVRATTSACNSLLDYLASSADFPALVRTALSCSADVAGKRFTDLLINVMQADAEADAERQVAAAERDAATDPDNCHPTRAQALQLERMQV